MVYTSFTAVNVGFVVGATVGGFFILLLPGVIVCTLILVVCVRTRRRRTIVRTTAASTEPLPVDTDSHRAPLLPSHDSQTAKLQHQPKQVNVLCMSNLCTYMCCEVSSCGYSL